MSTRPSWPLPIPTGPHLQAPPSRLILITVRPGKLARPHSHGCEQMINVVQGTAWFRVGDEEKNVGAGDVIHIPKGAIHEFRDTGDGEFIYLSFKNRSDGWPPKDVLEAS